MFKGEFMNNKKSLFFFILIFSFIIIFIYSSYNIYNWYIDSKNIKEINDHIKSDTVINEIDDDDKNIKIIKNDVDEFNPYWDYIKMKLIDVDLTKLKKENSDTVGWLQVNGTNINYPFVQTNII